MFLLVPAYPGIPGQKAVKRLCVCVCVCVCVYACVHACVSLLTRAAYWKQYDIVLGVFGLLTLMAYNSTTVPHRPRVTNSHTSRVDWFRGMLMSNRGPLQLLLWLIMSASGNAAPQRGMERQFAISATRFRPNARPSTHYSQL